jgi:hypothetical protein
LRLEAEVARLRKKLRLIAAAAIVEELEPQ